MANALSDAEDGVSRAYREPPGFAESECTSELAERVALIPGSNGYRLLTEAEWEWSASAGQHSRYSGPDTLSELCKYANIADASAKARWDGWDTASCDDGVAGLAEVGSKIGNAWRLYDMSGNVWEWVQDVYIHDLPGGTNPRVDAGGSNRVARGGSWFSPESGVRQSVRSWDSPGIRNFNVGLRFSRSE